MAKQFDRDRGDRGGEHTMVANPSQGAFSSSSSTSEGTAIPGSKADTEAAIRRQDDAKETTQGKKKAKYAFRVMTGSHIHGGRLYRAGEVVEVDQDLAARHNGPAGTQPKYLKVRGPEKGEEGAEEEEEPNLMTQASHQFPGGQVSDGLQESTSLADRRVVSGLKTKLNRAEGGPAPENPKDVSK